VRKALSYDDVLLIPQYSDIRSRSEVNLEANLGNGLILSTPIFASPMDTISEAPMAAALGEIGGSAIIHRYNTIQEQSRMISLAYEISNVRQKDKLIVGAAVGISDDYVLRARMALQAGASFICVDVAHGHHIMMKEALSALRDNFGNELHIMAGNVATLEGVNCLADWGADSVRCNIGGGSICSTRIQTGHGLPGLDTIFECARTDRNVAIIADGGLKNSGDVVKALAAGADAVMCGSMFSGTDETPGKIIEESDSTRWKTYRGMASKEAQMNWRGKYSSHEGVSARVPYRGSVKNILQDIDRGIRSGLSYSGARTIAELQSKANFVIQTSAGQGESKTHITNRTW
tara:strand:- start:8910 stop:9950 length:1041 start_codon:yes stop_codon:yes gene_type:complete